MSIKYKIQGGGLLPKGHMEIKSSAFAPSEAKLVNQHLIKDHMAAHYRKLVFAKSRIDNTPPKVMTSSTKVRDRNRLHAMEKLTRQTSQSVLSISRLAKEADQSLINRLDTPNNVTAAPKNRPHGTCMSARDLGCADVDLYSPRPKSDVASLRRYTYTERTRRNSLENVNNKSMTELRTSAQRVKDGGDLLHTQSHRFTEPKPFQPATLKRGAKSKIANLACYNAPNIKDKFTPRPRTSCGAGDGTTTAVHKVDRLLAEQRLQTSTAAAPSSQVPRLDIAVDGDHLKWLNEQSRMSRHRKQQYDEKNINIQNKKQMENKKKKDICDQEMLALKFVSDITNDVIDRGVFTNRVLKQVFALHTAANRGKISEDKMNSLLSNLEHDLGVPPDKSRPRTLAYKPETLRAIEKTSGVELPLETNCSKKSTLTSAHDTPPNIEVKKPRDSHFDNYSSLVDEVDRVSLNPDLDDDLNETLSASRQRSNQLMRNYLDNDDCAQHLVADDCDITASNKGSEYSGWRDDQSPSNYGSESEGDEANLPSSQGSIAAGNQLTLFQDNTDSNVDIAATYGVKTSAHSTSPTPRRHPPLTRDSLVRHQSEFSACTPSPRSRVASTTGTRSTVTRSSRRSKSTRHSKRSDDATAAMGKDGSRVSPQYHNPLARTNGKMSARGDQSTGDDCSQHSTDARSFVSTSSRYSRTSRDTAAINSQRDKGSSTPRSRYSSRRSSIASNSQKTCNSETVTPTHTPTITPRFQNLSPRVASDRGDLPAEIPDRVAAKTVDNRLGSTFSLANSNSSIEDITSLADGYEDNLDDGGTPPLSNHLISANATDPLSESIDLSELEKDAF